MNLRIQDPAPGDDTGSLRVRLVRVQPVSGAETLTVDTAAAAGSTTARVYPAGQPVRVQVSGSYAYGSGITADAECSITRGDATWRTGRSELVDREGHPLGDLKINGRTQDWLPTAGSARCDAANHTYALTYTPQVPGPLVLTMADRLFTDNSGRLTVTVAPVGGA